MPGLPAGTRGEQLVDCRYFGLARFRTEKSFDLPEPGRLSIWLLLRGEALLRVRATGYQRRFFQGGAVLVPAACPPASWDPVGSATLLRITLPGKG